MSFNVHENALPGLIREALKDAMPEDLAVAYMALTGRIPESISEMLDNEYSSRPGGEFTFYD